MIKDNEKFQCEFCKNEFIRENSLINHLCEKKRRWMNKDKKYVRIGYESWLKWYDLSNTKKPMYKKTYKEFMSSKYYIAFVKFGRHVFGTDMVNPNQFIEFVIKNHIKLDDWCKDSIYEEYVKIVCLKEDIETVMNRQVKLMEEWAKDNNEKWNDFFKKIQPNLALKWIKTGKISPWFLLNSNTLIELTKRMNDEQKQIMENSIDLIKWKIKIKRNPKDAIFIKEILEEYGI